VPDDAYVRPRTPVTGVSPPSTPPAANGLDRAAEQNDQRFEFAISTLITQLERERSRVDRAERRIDEERSRADRIEELLEEARAQIADTIGAERIAVGEASALRAELDRRRQWRLWRRLRWALRGDR
jgi:hypothetical protein